jgi:hypothetical protein
MGSLIGAVVLDIEGTTTSMYAAPHTRGVIILIAQILLQSFFN